MGRALVVLLCGWVLLASTVHGVGPDPVVRTARPDGRVVSAFQTPLTVATIPYGSGAKAIAPWKPGLVGHGMPTAFVVDPFGNIHLLVAHERAILVVSPEGLVQRKVRLHCQDGTDLPATAYPYDLAFDGLGNYVVLELTGGLLIRFNGRGKALGAFGCFVGAERVERTSTGEIVVHDAGESTIDRFTARGKFLGDIEDAALTPVANVEGLFVRTRLIGKHRGFVWLRNPREKGARLFTIIDPAESGAYLYELKPLGFRSDGSLVLLTTEKGQEGYASHLYRIARDGTVLCVVRVEANMEFATSLPRYYRLGRDDAVLTFRTTPREFILLAYDVPRR